MRRTSWRGGGGGEGWGQKTGKETTEKNVKQEICCRNTKFVFSAIITYPKKQIFSSNIGIPKSSTLTYLNLSRIVFKCGNNSAM